MPWRIRAGRAGAALDYAVTKGADEACAARLVIVRQAKPLLPDPWLNGYPVCATYDCVSLNAYK